MISILEIPGSPDWLLRRIDVRTEFRIRKELRRLEREADARLVVLWILGRVEVVSYAGDFHAMPRQLPVLWSTVPAHDEVVLSGGEREHAVTQQVVIGRSVVKMGVVMIAPGVMEGAALLDLVAATAQRLEGIVVEVVT